MQTGWVTEGPDEASALPGATFLLSSRAERGPVDPLERARLAPEQPDDVFDADERAMNLLARGVAPGMMGDLSQRLGDTLAELQDEREKIERGQRHQERLAREHAAGRVTAFEVARMSVDEGDPDQVARLERRAEGLRRQISEVSARIPASQNQAPADPLEAATQRARDAGHEAFAQRTRDLMAQVQAGQPVPRTAPRPFAGRGGVAVRSEQPVTCPDCIKYGATSEQSYMIHADPGAPAGVRLPVAELTDADLAELSRELGIPYRPAERLDQCYDSSGRQIQTGGREITRTCTMDGEAFDADGKVITRVMMPGVR